MQRRIHIRNNTHMIEWPDNRIGELQAKAFRSTHPEFKRRRLRRVLQAYPSQVEFGKIYALT